MSLRCHRRFRLLAGVLLCGLVCACTPVDQWREMRPDGAGMVAQFPCRPAKYTRSVTVGTQTALMTLHACTISDTTYAVGWFDVADPSHMEPALVALKAAALANVGTNETQSVELPLSVRGATVQRRAGRWQWDGKLPQGERVVEQFAAFTRGTRVVQAAVVVKAAAVTGLHRQRADAFFTALAWRE